MEKIKLAVVDDHTILRESLVNSLEEVVDFQITGHWSTGEELLLFARKNPIDITIIDNRLPGISGIETTKMMKEIQPECATIILTMYSCEKEVMHALMAGALGYIPKENSISELIAAIHSVHSGSCVIGSGVVHQLMKYHGSLMPVEASPSFSLTVEEKFMLQLAAAGDTYKEIAEKTGSTLGLVKFRFREISKKLDARDRTQAVVIALKTGVLTLND